MAKKKFKDEDEEIDGFYVDDEYFTLPRWPYVCGLDHWAPKGIDWLWEPFVPAGAVTLLTGATGVGKTYLSLALSAAVTRGWPVNVSPDIPASAAASLAPAGVLYLTVGNDPEQFLRPRFEKLGGDAARLHVLRGFTFESTPLEYGELKTPELSESLPYLLRRNKVRLLVIDPFETYLGCNRGKTTERLLELIELLSHLAEDHRCGVLLVGSMRPAARLSAAVRSELMAGMAPGDTPGERGLAQVKSNLGAVGRPLAYAIEAGDVLCWRGESGLSDAGLLLPEEDTQKRTALHEAMEFLRRELAAGPVPATRMRQTAKELGISIRTLKRAKAHLGILSDKDGQAKWDWRLPESSLNPAGINDGVAQPEAKRCVPAPSTAPGKLPKIHGPLGTLGLLRIPLDLSPLPDGPLRSDLALFGGPVRRVWPPS